MTDEPSHDLTDAILAQTEQVTKLATSAQQAADRVATLETTLGRYRTIIKIFAGLVVATLIVFGVLLVRLNVVANGNHSIQKQNQVSQAQQKKVLDFIKDCTDPKGKCSQKSAGQVEQAVQAIIDHLDSELDKRLPVPTP